MSITSKSESMLSVVITYVIYMSVPGPTMTNSDFLCILHGILEHHFLENIKKNVKDSSGTFCIECTRKQLSNFMEKIFSDFPSMITGCSVSTLGDFITSFLMDR